MDTIQESINRFFKSLNAGRVVEQEIVELRNRKFLLAKNAGNGLGLHRLAFELDAEYPGEVLQDKKGELEDLKRVIEQFKKINEALLKLFERELRFDKEEIEELKGISIKLVEDERRLIDFYKKNSNRINLTPREIQILTQVGKLTVEEEKEKQKTLRAISAIKSVHDSFSDFKGFIQKQIESAKKVLEAANRILDALVRGIKEHKDDITSIKAGVESLLTQFRDELKYYYTLSVNATARNKILGELKVEEAKREVAKEAVAKVAKKGKLRVLIIPCNWGFGPVSKAISIVNSLKEFDSVLDEVAIVASEEICKAAKRGFSKIKAYGLSDSQLYDRTEGIDFKTYQERLSNFIEFVEETFKKFKPNLVIDSLGYAGAPLAKVHNISVIKIDHLFPELTSDGSAQKAGIDLSKTFEVLKAQNRISEFKKNIGKSTSLRVLEWLGDVLSDYLIVPAFYPLEITPSVLQYRKNKNIYFVNPSMNREARLLLDDIFGVKQRISEVLTRFPRIKLKRKQNFTKTILVNTGGIFQDKEYPKAWELFVRNITALAKTAVSLNNKYAAEKKEEFIGLVLIGSFGIQRRFLEYIQKNWTADMRNCLLITGSLRFYNTIRLFLSADLIVTNAGQTSISELITLYRPFLLLLPYQSEMIRNFDFAIKSGIGLSFSSFLDKAGNPMPEFERTLIELLNPSSSLNEGIKANQIKVLVSLKELNGILAKIISEILGISVSYHDKTRVETGKIITGREMKIGWNKKFSVVVPIMDKESKFLDNCLYKLRVAESSPEKVEILVVDFESGMDYYKEYERLCRQYKAILIRIQRRGRLFNLALLRNYGARKVTGDYLVWCDADVIVPSNTFDRVKEVLIKNPKTMIIGRVFIDNKWRDPNFYKAITDDEMRELVVKEKLRFGARGFGGFIVSDREWVYEARGFDESYPYWGAEDYDFWFRSVYVKRKPFTYLDNIGHFSQNEVMNRKGLVVEHLYPTDVVMIHQTHGPAYWTKDARLQNIIELNQIRKEQVKKRKALFVNSPNWGTNKIKVLRIVSVLTVGGVEIVTIKQCEAMVQDGNFDVRLLIAKPDYESGFVEHLSKIGIDVRVSTKEYDREVIGKLCEDELIDFKPEIVFITNLREASANIKRIKEIFQEMKVVFRTSISSWDGLTLTAEYKWADVVVCLYKGLADLFVQKIKGLERNKIFILGNGIDNTFFEVKPSNKNRVCIIARSDPQKGLVSFVNIINEVRKAIPNVEAIIIGGPYEKFAESVRSYQLALQRIKETDAPVKFTGLLDIESLTNYISWGKVFLFTSIREGFPSAFWQGVAAGLIPVTTSVGNISEVLRGKKQAYLCEIPVDERLNDRLPVEIEMDLARKCIEALRSTPDVKSIKQLAMPYRMDIWSKRFISLLKNLVGVESGIRWDDDGLEVTKETREENGKGNLKVMRLIPALTIGGMEIIAMKECEVLARNGFDVTLLIPLPQYKREFVENMKKVGVDAITTDQQLTREDRIKFCEYFILKIKPDIILISSLPDLAEKIRELKQKFAEMEIIYRITSSHKVAISIANRYRWVDLMIILYPSLTNLLQREIPEFKKTNTVVLGNPIEDKWFKIRPSTSNTVCVSARISPEKCLISFVSIINEVKKQVPDVKGIIIGGAHDNPEAKESLKLVEQKVKETNAPITITGFTDNVADYLSKSKIYLTTSATEGFPVGFWEGIAAGLIPVATAVGNIPEALQGKIGVYICNIPVSDTTKNQLPKEVEQDLARKCVQALKSTPDVKAIKQLAMPYHYGVWSKQFVSLMETLARK